MLTIQPFNMQTSTKKPISEENAKQAHYAKKCEQYRRGSAKYLAKHLGVRNSTISEYIKDRYKTDEAFRLNIQSVSKQKYYTMTTIKYVRYLYI